MILVTGGAGFIGANFVLDWIAATGEPVLNLDAPHLRRQPREPEVAAGRRAPRLRQGRHLRPRPARPPARRAPPARRDPLRRREPRRPQHPRPRRLHQDEHRGQLHAARGGAHWSALPARRKRSASITSPPTGLRFAQSQRSGLHRDQPLRAQQPLLGQQGASDHLVRAWHHTYGLPVLTTNCSNNYGPHHFPEADPADDRQRWRASRCRSTATACRCATGST